MGLAASQARFLGITARKNACELRSMEIAQERLSVSNQLSQASQNYMTSLNATKLIWNPERTDDYIYQLDYASMSRPSAYNDFNLQLLTNIKGQTVLDTSFYEALCNLPNGAKFKGEDGSYHSFDDYKNGGIERSEANFKKFIQALNEQGIINNAYMQEMFSAMNYTSSNADSVAYAPNNGFGENLANIGEVYSTDLMGLCEYVDDFTIFSQNEDDGGYLQDLYNKYGSNPIAPTPYDMANDVYEALTFEDFLSTVYSMENHSTGSTGISVVQNAVTPQPAEVYFKAALRDNGGDFTHEWHVDDHTDQTHVYHNIPDWSITDDFQLNFADLMGKNDVALVGYYRCKYGVNGGNYYNIEQQGATSADFIKSIDSFVDNLVYLAKNFFEYDGGEDAEALEQTVRVIKSLYKNSNGSLRTIDGNFQYVDGIDHIDSASGTDADRPWSNIDSGKPGYTHTYCDSYSGGVPDYNNYFITVEQTSIDKQGHLANGDYYQEYTTAYALSLSNLAQAFFTEYENQRGACTGGYNVATSTGYLGDCNLITMDQNYVYDYIDAGTTNPTGEITQILNYFSQMFNQICVKGYTYNPAVEDPAKMQNMIKNGSLMVSTIADDNYFYQYDYQAYGVGGGYFKEVADEDAITAAEAEYKVRQAQLNAKEEELAVDMQNVEAELAALTTEYDTVKNLINKSVQKDFTTCGG
ncbi:hypothetical protein J6S88_03425 [bacterium]|nr:hypothetical protein [bacterium]